MLSKAKPELMLPTMMKDYGLMNLKRAQSIRQKQRKVKSRQNILSILTTKVLMEELLEEKTLMRTRASKATVVEVAAIITKERSQ